MDLPDGMEISLLGRVKESGDRLGFSPVPARSIHPPDGSGLEYEKLTYTNARITKCRVPRAPGTAQAVSSCRTIGRMTDRRRCRRRCFPCSQPYQPGKSLRVREPPRLRNPVGGPAAPSTLLYEENWIARGLSCGGARWKLVWNFGHDSCFCRVVWERGMGIFGFGTEEGSLFGREPRMG